MGGMCFRWAPYLGMQSLQKAATRQQAFSENPRKPPKIGVNHRKCGKVTKPRNSCYVSEFKCKISRPSKRGADDGWHRWLLRGLILLVETRADENCCTGCCPFPRVTVCSSVPEFRKNCIDDVTGGGFLQGPECDRC